MLKSTAQYYKFKRAIILSIALHCSLIAVLIWRSFHQQQETSIDSKASTIEAIMVDPIAIVQQYNHKQQYDKQAQQQAEERQRLKTLKKQRLSTQETTETQQHQKAKQQKQAERKKAAAAKIKKQPYVQETTVTTSKYIKQTAIQSSDVDTLLSNLIDPPNVPKTVKEPTGTYKTTQNSATIAEIDDYKEQVKRAISNKFYDASHYSGRTCNLHIKLASDGLLISIKAVGGDPELCQVAISAAKLANIPRPPSPQVYDFFKDVTLRFSPQ